MTRTGDDEAGAAGVQHWAGEAPDARELLAVARETLLARVLPSLDGDGRYQALMVANAIAIALRELDAADSDLAAEVARLRGLYEDPQSEVPDEPLAAALERLEAQVARDLRDGVLDGGPQYAVRHWLRARLHSRLAVSNPKALDRHRNGEEGA